MPTSSKTAVQTCDGLRESSCDGLVAWPSGNLRGQIEWHCLNIRSGVIGSMYPLRSLLCSLWIWRSIILEIWFLRLFSVVNNDPGNTRSFGPISNHSLANQVPQPAKCRQKHMTTIKPVKFIDQTHITTVHNTLLPPVWLQVHYSSISSTENNNNKYLTISQGHWLPFNLLF